jgi:hypothetical protein
MVSVRVFDEAGVRLDNQMKYYDLDGNPVDALYRRPDGTIIDNPL